MKQRIFLLGIVFIGLLLRLYKLSYHDFWYDEAISVLLSKDFQSRLDPPLFFAVMHFWIKLFGRSEFIVRIPALIFSTLSIPLTFLLGKKLFNWRIGIISAAVMALSPFQLWYAQEARCYSLFLFFGTLSTFLFILSIQGKVKYWYYFIVSSILAMYSGEIYIFLLLTHIILLVIYVLSVKGAGQIKYLLLSLFFFSFYSLLIFYLYQSDKFRYVLPGLYFYIFKFNYILKGFWLPRPDIFSLPATLENFLMGYNLTKNYYLITDFLIAALLIAAVKFIYDNKNIRNNFCICAFLTIFPVFTIYIFSKYIAPIYLDRVLIIFSPYFYILLAVGISRLLSKKTGLLIYVPLCFLFTISIISFYNDYMPTPFRRHPGVFIKKPFKPIVEFIDDNFKQGDVIGVTNINPPIIPSLTIYDKRNLPFYFFFYPGMIDPNNRQPVQETDRCIPFHKISELKFKKLWIISTDGGERTGGLDENSSVIKDWLDEKFELESAREFDGLQLFIYVKK